jgi:hypothetical protein
MECLPRRYPVSMNEKPKPPLPADESEARFDDEGSAIGHPQPDETKRSKQKAKTGAEIPVPERGESNKNRGKANKPEHG